jgi:hypothetical protein
MAGKLVTIARFDLAGQAHIAKNALEAVGIKSVLADEQTVAMDWLLSNAIGGIKVQVLEEDAERAVTALEESLGSDEPVDEETMAAEAEATETEEHDEPSEPVAPQADPPPPPAGIGTEEGPAGKPSERDDYARRLFLTSVFAVVVPPLWFYSIYLFLNAAFGEGPINEKGRTDLLRGGAIMGVGLLVLFALMLVYWSLYG